ncbi:hypothetical protein NW762_002988 [Fusarium torreyae]|uniref:Uncharacterized protein n=1 Tax=Fusarium torreyae TaxID=1237075 RepID=A0A9W8SAV0_9HYPO|nr:hypothetical protein NW762_002988 [Fusarium torreyae]
MQAQKRRKRAQTPDEQDDAVSISESPCVSPAELPTMEILGMHSQYKPCSEGEKEDDFVFDYTKMSLRFSTGELFYTIIHGEVYVEVIGAVFHLDQMDFTSIGSIAHQFAAVLARDLELPSDHQLVLVPIPEEIIYPQFSSSLTVAPEQINIMMDPSDNPVIIDFDACRREGDRLVKVGTEDWALEGITHAAYENDFYGLSKLEEFLTKPPEQDDHFEQD